MGQCRHCDHGTIAIHSIAKPSFGDRLNVINTVSSTIETYAKRLPITPYRLPYQCC